MRTSLCYLQGRQPQKSLLDSYPAHACDDLVRAPSSVWTSSVGSMSVAREVSCLQAAPFGFTSQRAPIKLQPSLWASLQ